MDHEAFESVVHEHKDRIYSYAARILRGAAEAQDVAQEALVKLWQHRERVEGETAHFWLRRTVHNLCIDRIRRRKASPGVAMLGKAPPSPKRSGAGSVRAAVERTASCGKKNPAFAAKLLDQAPAARTAF